ncbi:MAG: hypothetical protein WC444_03725 [Candidatus Paceibacterota bacterium]
MSNVLANADAATMLSFQKVILIAGVFNDARISGAVEEEFMIPSQRLLVRAFAEVLGEEFVLCEGEILNITQDTNFPHGASAQIRFDSTRKVVNVKTSRYEHSWLCLLKFDVWIDVTPPGSDPRWLSPVKYSPGGARPAYRKLDKNNEATKPKQSDVRRLSQILDHLWQEAIGEGVA